MRPITADECERIKRQYAAGWSVGSIACITRHGKLTIKRILGLTTPKKSGRKGGVRRAPRAD